MLSFRKKAAMTGLILTAFIFVAACSSVVTLTDSGNDTSFITLDANQYVGITVADDNILPPLEIPKVTSPTGDSDIETTEEINTDTNTHETADTAIEETPQSYIDDTTKESTDPQEEKTTPPESSADTTPDYTTSAETTLPPVVGINKYQALNYSEVKGVWISYIELCSMLQCKSEDEFRKNIGTAYDNCVNMGLNTVYVHLRPYGDAIYKSDYYPWSKYCTGTVGNVPSFDPLTIMIDEAHKRKLSFQGWINPLRCNSDSDIKHVPNNYQTKKWYNNNAGDYISKVGNYWYLNPAYKEVTDLISRGAAEIAAKYNVDGLHIDDYFYPTTETWFDSKSFNNNSETDLSAFRLNNCSDMVKKMYSAIKNANSSALFGVSTQGNISNNYNQMYADVEKWCMNTGYVDYMAPQIYYGFNNSSQPYNTVLSQWQQMVQGTNIKLIPGLSVYKCGTYDEWAGNGAYEWVNSSDIIRRQIISAGKTKNYGGIILYSYDFLFNTQDNEKAIKKEISAFASLLK